MIRTDDSAAGASNWRMVLAVDALLGIIVSLIGLVLFFLVSVAIGVAAVVLGAVYVALVGARARRWARLRRTGTVPGRSASEPR